MWMRSDMGCPETNDEFMTLDWEALGRLVRKRTEEVLAQHLAMSETLPERHTPSSYTDGRRASESS